ncbi:MAG: hypothetical protein M1511_12495 [Deltaproteobacteria bacterium]|nr:hypothetical protein [Deltaproteobacteria bacterium]
MKKLLGHDELERVESAFNGEVVVDKSEGEVRFLVGGITQSGRFIDQIWGKGISYLKNNKFKPRSCLILGLGGGTVAQLVSKTWPGIAIVGVEIDPVMTKLGKKYLGLSSISGLRIIIDDAVKFIGRTKERYDLILVDAYRGEAPIDWSLRTDSVFGALNPGGVAVFNLLFHTDEFRQRANTFIDGLAGYKVKLLRELTNLLVVVKGRK